MHNFNIGEFGVVDWRVWKLEKSNIAIQLLSQYEKLHNSK